MAGTLSKDGRRSELELFGLLGAHAFFASFEEIADFLIDKITEGTIGFFLGESVLGTMENIAERLRICALFRESQEFEARRPFPGRL
jgi:hypothetical protein